MIGGWKNKAHEKLQSLAPYFTDEDIEVKILR